MTDEHPPTPRADDRLRDAVRHRRDTSDSSRAAELRAGILAAATTAPPLDPDGETDDDTGDRPTGVTSRGRRRMFLAAAAIVLVLAGIATVVIVDGQRTAEATAREVLRNAADATRAGGTARYEMSLPFTITFGTDPDAEPLARYEFGCVLDFDYDAGGSFGRCESRRIEGAPLFDFLEDSYEILSIDGLDYERNTPDDPWVESTFIDPDAPFAQLFDLLDPVSTLDFFTADSADVADGSVVDVEGTGTRRVETTISVPFENEVADAVIEADIVAFLDADDQVIRIEAAGISTTDTPFVSQWPFELGIVRTAVDIDVDLSLDG